MGTPRVPPFSLNVWPAFTDTMLAFVLVLVLVIVFQLARSVEVLAGDDPAAAQVDEDQQAVERALLAASERYGLGLSPEDVVEDGVIQEVTLGSDITFRPGSADLSPAGQRVLTTLAQSVVRAGVGTLVEVQVSGHTDPVPINTREFPTNWELSTARASRIVRHLTEGGIDPERVRLSATGFSAYRPVAPNTTATNMAANRRIEIRLVYSEQVA